MSGEQLRRLAHSDFSAGALWLVGMELAAARRLRISRVFLHPQLTEIALARRVAGLFTEFSQRAVALGMEAGLITHNPVRAAEVLGDGLERFATIVAPCNAKGYKMVPDRGACEALFRSDPGRFWAAKITAGGSIAVADGLEHVRRLGLAGSVLDYRDSDAAFREASRSEERALSSRA